jgi:predicted DNA-binding transcriptional regulator YafY
MAKPANRSDAERRLRQALRLARVLQVLQCIGGTGRWDAHSLATEMECSVRTIHRVLHTLMLAGIPVRYDAASKAYRLPPNFAFPGLRFTKTLSEPEGNIPRRQ